MGYRNSPPTLGNTFVHDLLVGARSWSDFPIDRRGRRVLGEYLYFDVRHAAAPSVTPRTQRAGRAHIIGAAALRTDATSDFIINPPRQRW